MSSHLCIADVAVVITPAVFVVMSKPVRARKPFKKTVLSLNDFVVVDINSKKTTKLKLRVSDLKTSTLIPVSISQTKLLRKFTRRPSSFILVNFIIIVFNDDNDDKKNNEKKNKKRKEATIDKMNVVALIKAHISKKNNKIIGGKKRSNRIKNIKNNNNVIVLNT